MTDRHHRRARPCAAAAIATVAALVITMAVPGGVSAQSAKPAAPAATTPSAPAGSAAPAGSPTGKSGVSSSNPPSAGLPAANPSSALAAPTPASPPVRVLLVAGRETTVVAQMVGRVERLGGDLGANVKAGAPLVVFECGEPQARLRIAEAELDAARQQHETKQRLQSLNAAGDTEVQLAATGVARAKAQLDLSREQTSQCRIDSPFAGRIVKLHVRPYQGVSVGQPLVEVVAGGPLKLRLNAPSRWLAWLRQGTPFKIEIDETGRTYTAVVTAINGRVDAASQSVEIEGTVRGTPPELLAGMSGNATFDVPR